MLGLATSGISFINKGAMRVPCFCMVCPAPHYFWSFARYPFVFILAQRRAFFHVTKARHRTVPPLTHGMRHTCHMNGYLHCGRCPLLGRGNLGPCASPAMARWRHRYAPCTSKQNGYHSLQDRVASKRVFPLFIRIMRVF